MDLPGPGLLTIEERLSGWRPSRLARRFGRILVAVWAAPATVLGFGVAAIADGRRRWDDRFGVWVVEDARGPVAEVQRASGWIANTIGYVVVANVSSLSERTLVHEAVHVRQHERLGPLLAPLYLWYWARRGYRDHPLERAARSATPADP
ncbi:MAG: hypothetical protein KY437_09030 [Actinobacteria bacterium]|nr:hypothetical protein [Actinomycetota bacterium]